MKTLIKLILGIIIFLIVIVGIPVALLLYNISDKTDDTPHELYSENITYSDTLGDLISDSFNLENKDSLDITFSEDELNIFIFGLIKEYINDTYNPTKVNPSDEEAFIQNTASFKVPVLGDRKVVIKSAYAQINDGQLEVYITLDLLGVKSRAKLITTFSEDTDNYIVTFKNVGLGKMNMFSGVGKWIITNGLKINDSTENKINDDLKAKNLPFVLDLKNQLVNIPKGDINLLINKLLDPSTVDDDGQAKMMTSLMDLLSNKDNDLINFGIANEKFGLSFDLTKFKVEDNLKNLDTEVKIFDSNLYMKNKVQGYIISTLFDTNQSKMYFSNLDLSKIVYDQSNGYEDFTVEIPLPNSTSTFKFEVKGVILSFNESNVEIRIIINLNGLTTSLLLNGTIQNNNTSVVSIVINDTITLGQDDDEVVSEYVTANSDLILGLLGSNIDEMGIMEYNSDNKSFILSADSFTQLMKVEGTNITPLTIEKLKIVNGGLEAYAKPEGLLNIPVAASSFSMSNTLEVNDFVLSDFDTTESTELEKVNALLDSLDSLATKIQNNDIEEVDTDLVIHLFNQLNNINQEAFIDGIESESGSAELVGLYDLIFGK